MIDVFCHEMVVISHTETYKYTHMLCKFLLCVTLLYIACETDCCARILYSFYSQFMNT